MYEFNFFHKVLNQKGVNKFISEWKNSILDGKPLDHFKYDADNFRIIESQVAHIDQFGNVTESEAYHFFSNYIKEKYSEEKGEMLLKCEERYNNSLLEIKVLQNYQKELRKTYHSLKVKAKTNLYIAELINLHAKEIFLITGIDFISDSISVKSNKGLNLKLSNDDIETLKEVYNLELRYKSIIDKNRTSIDDFIQVFNEKSTDSKVYITCYTREFAHILSQLYNRFNLNENRTPFYQRIEDSQCFITKQNRVLTKSNIQGSEANKDFQSYRDIISFFNRLK